MTQNETLAWGLIPIAALALIAGCSGKAEESKQVTQDFTVERLFTHEGCTVYRFMDGGYKRYFTNCQGSTSWSQSHGKAGTTPHSIPTEVSK